MADMATTEVRGTIDIGPGEVSSIWTLPGDVVATLVLGHGAGAGMDHPFLAGFCRAIGAHGVATLRFNFPYIERGRRSPDPESTLRRCWLSAFEAGSERSGGQAVLAGGKSLGGRIASMCVADGMQAAGLVFLGYPLHPPGKPDRIRDGHLYRIGVPMLFLHGTEDPFAQPELLRRVVRRLGDRAEYHAVAGGDHSFNVKGSGRDAREVGAGLAELAASFVRRVAGAR
jgi:predicted alpha/beta-hydrolase family hydrolase